jgi:hypothetical protein
VFPDPRLIKASPSATVIPFPAQVVG